MLGTGQTRVFQGLARSAPPVRVVWEGSQFVHHSLALVNRELTSRLLGPPFELSLRPFEPDSFDGHREPRWQSLSSRIAASLSAPAQVEVRHRWPPRLDPAASGRLVVILPWEYGSLPRDWIRPLQENVDEVWVPSNYVRDCFRESGIDVAKVHVVPNGVDVSRFRPGVAKMSLPTSKRFKFLFVGGTIARKGIHGLLEAYARAFSSTDDVCLVIKDVGTQGVYRGSTARDLIQRLQADPAMPEILHLEEDLSDEEIPGLYAAADAFVHPYRGEGFGLPIAEAMAMEKTVLVTGMGAALDFCDEENAVLLPARRENLPENRIGSLETVGTPWLATPDLDGLTQRLRAVFDSPEDFEGRGRRARLRILEEFSWDGAARIAASRLLELGRA